MRKVALTMLGATLLLGECASSGPSAEGISWAKSRGQEPGTIAPGDHANYVRAQWGEPSSIETATYENSTGEWWRYCYQTGHYRVCDQAVFFIDDKVAAIHQEK